MENNDRREFIKKSFLGISGAALFPLSAKSDAIKNSAINPPELPFRNLGKTGIKTPLLSMGTGNTTTSGFIRTGYESGVKLFFSATYYGEGNNEKLVGEGLKGLPRDSFVVGTAVPPDGLDNRLGTFTKPFDTQAYIRKAEESLKRFGLDYVDILLFPYAGKRAMVLNEGALKALEQLKRQGKTRFVGIASHSDVEEALTAASDSGIYDLAMIAYNFKSLNKESLNAAITRATQKGMGIVAMKTTAGAFDSKSGPQLNSNAALKWVLKNNSISSIVSGMSTFEELQKNLSMIRNIEMTDQELNDLKLSDLNSGSGLYCHQCRECIPQCPQNLDIPTIMRSYMYAYGYRDTSKAWHALETAGLKDKPCETCRSCSINCAAGFDVRNRVMDIARLREVPKDFIKA